MSDQPATTSIPLNTRVLINVAAGDSGPPSVTVTATARHVTRAEAAVALVKAAELLLGECGGHSGVLIPVNADLEAMLTTARLQAIAEAAARRCTARHPLTNRSCVLDKHESTTMHQTDTAGGQLEVWPDEAESHHAQE